ncbi:hypothetical protein [Micromonospora chalcea]|uniref:hypothetical protein n=1 Tax=Micromonospora chalcea TaxID=1874 RepID=UPI0037F27637
MTATRRRPLGVLELSALPSIGEEHWVHWMRQSGLADLMPSLRDTVWVGLSAVEVVSEGQWRWFPA